MSFKNFNGKILTCKSIFWYLIKKRYSTDTRVVVTGLGMLNPIGVGVKTTWKNLLQCKTGVISLNTPEYDDIPCKVAAFIPQGTNSDCLNIENSFSASEFKKISLTTAYALIAAEEALKDSKWQPTTIEDYQNTGVAVGTGMINLEDIVSTGNILVQKGYKKVSPFFVPRILSNMAAGHIAMKFGFKGPNHSVSTACATGLHAIGDAYNFIRNKYASVMVCGSAEAVISPISIAGFCRMRALSTNFNDQPLKASRPFDAKRDGFVMGEGAGILVLESLTHAIKRGAYIYAEVLGYGLSGDAYHMSSPSTDGAGAYRCMLQALENSKIDKSKVGYINAHATSTPLGDDIELKAIHNLFKEHSSSLIVSSTKGATGHLLGGAGSIEAIFTILSCTNKVIPPNINLEYLDSKYPVNVANNVSQTWPKNLGQKQIGLTNSFGFGGTNASVLFSNYDE